MGVGGGSRLGTQFCWDLVTRGLLVFQEEEPGTCQPCCVPHPPPRAPVLQLASLPSQSGQRLAEASEAQPLLSTLCPVLGGGCSVSRTRSSALEPFVLSIKGRSPWGGGGSKPVEEGPVGPSCAEVRLRARLVQGVSREEGGPGAGGSHLSLTSFEWCVLHNPHWVGTIPPWRGKLRPCSEHPVPRWRRVPAHLLPRRLGGGSVSGPCSVGSGSPGRAGWEGLLGSGHRHLSRDHWGISIGKERRTVGKWAVGWGPGSGREGGAGEKGWGA